MDRFCFLALGLACGIGACSSPKDAGSKPRDGGGIPTGSGGSAGGDLSGGAGGTRSGGAGGDASGGAGGNASGGGTGTAGAGGTSGGGGGRACEDDKCKRPFACVRTCGGVVESYGCCPCEPPLFDDFAGTACGDGGSDNDGGLTAFCTGATPRMVVNGITTAPTVTGHQLALDCCEGGRFVFTSTDFRQPIAVDWSVQVGPVQLLPATVDIASLPDRWAVRLSAGCNVLSAGCVGSLDYFSSGFVGSLSASYVDGGVGLDMSLCLHFEEPVGAPGVYVHALDLYAPHISTGN